jgi:hypothetical protein
VDKIRFACGHCKGRLKAPKQMAGRSAACPQCGKNTLVPDSDEESGTYGLSAVSDDPLSAASASLPALNKQRPTNADWCVPGYEQHTLLPALDEARSLARQRQWKEAVKQVTDLFQSRWQGQIESSNLIVRKPLAFCLTHWAAEQLAQVESRKLEVSHPLRGLLKAAALHYKHGGRFGFQHCGICGKQLLTLEGKLEVKTVAGSAYLCCATPTEPDRKLVARLDRAWKRLSFACALDADNAEARQAQACLPRWYTMLSPPDQRKQWCGQVGSLDADQSVGGQIAAGIGQGIVLGILDSLLG